MITIKQLEEQVSDLVEARSTLTNVLDHCIEFKSALGGLDVDNEDRVEVGASSNVVDDMKGNLETIQGHLAAAVASVTVQINTIQGE